MKCGDPNNPAGPGYSLRTGEPCKRDCIRGATRCSLHGGMTPTALIKAEQALATMRMPAIESLHEMLDSLDADRCPTCGYPRNDIDEKKLRLATVRTIMDRTGMGPRSTLELAKQSDGDLNLTLLTEDEKTQLLAIHAQAQAIKTAVRSRQSMGLDRTVEDLPTSGSVN